MKKTLSILAGIASVFMFLGFVDAPAAASYPPALGGTGTSIVPASGTVPIGNGAGTYTPALITPGTDIIITNASGSVTIAVKNSDFLPSSTVYVASVNGQSGTVTINVPATTTINGVQAAVFKLIGDGATTTSTVNGATTTFSIINTGNWAGTWQSLNSTTFYLASNPSAYVTTSTGLTTANFSSANISQWTNDSGYITTSTFNATGTTGYFPSWRANSLTPTSSLFQSGTNIGLMMLSPQNIFDSIAGAHDIELQTTSTAPTLATSTATSTPGTLPASTTYFFVVAATDGIGQTTPTNEASITTPSVGTSSIIVSSKTIPNSPSYRIYFATSSNAEAKYFLSSATATFSFTTTTAATAGTTSSINTAYGVLLNSATSSYITGPLAIGTPSITSGDLLDVGTSTLSLRVLTNGGVTIPVGTLTMGTGAISQTAVGTNFFYDGSFSRAAAQVFGGSGTPLWLGGDVNGSGTIAFETTASAAPDSMFIAHSGFVGINTNSPSSTLHVVGGITVTGSSTVSVTVNSAALLAGACNSATTSIDTYFTTSSTAFAIGPQVDAGDQYYYKAFIGTPGVLTAKVCATTAGTPATTTVNIKLIK